MLPDSKVVPSVKGPIKWANALTIDLEEWFHGLTRTNTNPDRWPEMTRRAEYTVSMLLDILEEAGVRATFFVLGDLAEQSPGVVKKIAEAGHELGSHGYSHRPVHSLDPGVFREELKKTQDIICDITGIPIYGFRAPYFSIDKRCLWAFEVLAEAGFQYDSSVFPFKTILYGYPGANRRPYRPLEGVDLVEYPISTIRLARIPIPVGGGFYWRMLPYAVIHWSLRNINRNGYPAILYLHPWELDAKQRRIPVSPRERLTHYGGRDSLVGKLQRLFQDFELIPLGELHQEWVSLNG
jgi:polysaccharide deacetylase family protein (PEP-CTERM system associated)